MIFQCVVAGCRGFHRSLRKTATHTHRVRYHQAPKFQCDLCEKSFPEESWLQKHKGSHRHCPCPMCGVPLNPNGLRRHIRSRHANSLRGAFTLNLCLSCLEVDCDGECHGRENRRSRNEILRIAFEQAVRHLGIRLTDLKADISDSDTPKLIVYGKYKKVCEKLANLKAFETAVERASSYEYM